MKKLKTFIPSDVNRSVAQTCELARHAFRRFVSTTFALGT